MWVAVAVPLITDTSTSMMLQNWRPYLPTVWWKAPAPGARRRGWPWCPRSSPYSRRAPQTATGVARGTPHHGRAWCHRCAAGVHLKTSGAQLQMWCPSVFPWAVLHLWIHRRHSVALTKAPLSRCLLFQWKIWIGKEKMSRPELLHTGSPSVGHRTMICRWLDRYYFPRQAGAVGGDIHLIMPLICAWGLFLLRCSRCCSSSTTIE